MSDKLPHPIARVTGIFDKVRQAFEGEQASQETRRAFALLYALQTATDPTSLAALLSFAGDKPHSDTALVISRKTCGRLARALSAAGYPLTDDGIARFRIERGFSAEVRLDAEVARAYARFATGTEALLNITDVDWQRFDVEQRRALQILMLIGRTPDHLQALRQRLGIHDSARAPQGAILVGRASVERFLEWVHAYDITLTDAGCHQIARAAGFTDSQSGEALAHALAGTLLDHEAPPDDYRHVLANGMVINRRTAAMLHSAELILKTDFPLVVTKGSYLSSSGLGAHPHIGGGVIDLATHGHGAHMIEHAVRVLRGVGFAVWYRPRPNNPHLHAIAIGDRDMSAAARWQVKAYFQGKDGRTRSNPDPHGGPPHHLPPWVLKYRIPFA